MRHHHRHGPDRLRYYVRARMHRRIFSWFGAAIVFSGVVFGGAHWLMRDAAHGRLAVPLVCAFVTLWIAAGSLAWRLTRPLAQLARVARDIGDGKLQSRVKLRWQDGEVGVLADAINDMATKIERQMAEQRELLAAVSHELRTPLTRMRVLIELGRERPDRLVELEQEIAEMDALVGDLLASARIDFSALHLQSLVPGTVAARALERGGESPALLVDESSGEVNADPTLLLRALANLLDNARKHGGGVKRLRVRERVGRVAFEVEDAGNGFSEEAAQRLFQPFSGTGGESSLGLGLALVRRIAVAHGGSAYAENLPTGGALVGFEIGKSISEEPMKP